MVKVFVNAGPVLEFIGQQYRHCKPILVLGNGRAVAERAGVKLVLPSGELDSGVLYFQDDNFGEVLPHFVEAIAAHRHFARETDPPQV
jgi:catalase